MRPRSLSALFTVSLAALSWGACSGSTEAPPAGADDAGADTSAPPVDSGGAADTDAPPVDAGTDAQDGGGIDAPEVTLQYGSCQPFTACGGDPTGTWKYAAGGCVDALQVAQCPQLTVSTPSFKIRGIVTFAGGTATRHAEAVFTAKLGIPKACVDALPIASCAGVQLGLTLAPPTGAGLDSATCTSDGAGGCSCDVMDTTTEQSTGPYVVENGGMTIRTTNDDKTYDFCVGGDAGPNTLTYRETTAGAALPATLVLAK